MFIFKGKNAAVHQIKALTDNYTYVISTKDHCVFVDPTTPEVGPSWVDAHGAHPVAILNTHHHHDHIGGNQKLQQLAPVKTYGSAYDHKKGRLPGQTEVLTGGQQFSLLGLEFHVLDVAAHTLGHIAYWVPEENWVFVGDSLFSLGCGRLFEGQGSHLYNGLKTLRDLPDATLVFCAHEYTLSNLRFHAAVFPKDPLLPELQTSIQSRLETEGKTVPSTLGFEKKYNPFLRWEDQGLSRAMMAKDKEDYVTQLRRKKDQF